MPSSSLIGSMAALAALAALAAGCGGSGSAGSAPSSGPATFLPSTRASSAPPTASPSGLSACALLKRADVLAVAAMFPGAKITIDGHHRHSEPPTNECGFNQKGVLTGQDPVVTLSGDQWASLTVVTGGAAYDYNPSGDTIGGLGDGAYWDAGANTVVVRVGRNVLNVVDNVPAGAGSTGLVAANYRKAATELAAKILSHL